MKKDRALVYLVRHAVAEESHPLGDAARALTVDGRDAFRAHAAALAKRVRLIGIASSPLVRAVQTAEILAEALEVREVRIHGELGHPGGSRRSVAGLARKLGPGWALVGHNPSLGEALAHLLGQSAEAARFRKGAVAALQPGALPDEAWELRWLREPGRKPKRQIDV
jgi:phosphohistidine phosphatase